MQVSFYGRSYGGAEQRYIEECLGTGLETDGRMMKRLCESFQVLFPGTHYLFTTSCTSALEMAVAGLCLRPGDEVIMPSYNFPSAANAVLMHGGIPVFCDIDGATQNLSLADVKRKISARTKAVIAVHYAGIACSMEALLELSRESGIDVIEDAAQGIGAGYADREQNIHPLGTLGRFGAVSFHHTKNITCGEGGVMIAAQAEDYRRAAEYRLHGTNRFQYLAGETDRYTWNLPGSCTAMGELQAAILAAQMEILDEVNRRRLAVAGEYRMQLKELERRGMARLMAVPDYARPNGHIFYLRFETEAARNYVRDDLYRRGIDSKTHYVPLHMSPQGRKMGYREDDLKESARCFRTLLRLPVHGRMSKDQAEQVADAVNKACADIG